VAIQATLPVTQSPPNQTAAVGSIVPQNVVPASQAADTPASTGYSQTALSVVCQAGQDYGITINKTTGKFTTLTYQICNPTSSNPSGEQGKDRVACENDGSNSEDKNATGNSNSYIGQTTVKSVPGTCTYDTSKGGPPYKLKVGTDVNSWHCWTRVADAAA